MTRRTLLASLAAFALDPDRLLWMPNRKHYSIPAPTLNDSDIVEIQDLYIIISSEFKPYVTREGMVSLLWTIGYQPVNGGSVKEVILA